MKSGQFHAKLTESKVITFTMKIVGFYLFS